MTSNDQQLTAPDQFETPEQRQARWEAAALAAGREIDRNALRAYMAVADAEQQALADEWAKTLANSDAEVRRLRARVVETDRKLAHAERIRENADFHLGQEMARRQLAEKEADRLRIAMEQIRHLHKDSPMGPCPVCIDADAIAEGRDGLMPYPCPTGRLAGAQDCEPPSHNPAARSAAV
ncbi:hypothetical protein ACWET9_32390 [Streptomyces sp. NPDC004059]